MYVHARGTKNSIHARKICAYKRSSKSFAQTEIPIFRSGIRTYIPHADTYMCVRKYVDTYFDIGNEKVILGEKCVGSIEM